MQNNESVEIKLTKVIHAHKWKIIRLLTRVWDFPSFIPCVKEASVIHKGHRSMKTKWKIQVDEIPISWIEEDSLIPNKDTISFNAVEGDLEEFKGEWRLLPHPEGTEVQVCVNLRVGVPAIKDFADQYVSRVVTRSFQAILDALEHRLISRRYQQYKKDGTETIAGFGIIGHPYDFQHLEKCFTMLNPNFKMPSQEFIGKLFHTTPSFKMYDVEEFTSKTGDHVKGCCIMATFIPDMIEKDIWTVFSKVVKACKIAEKYGVGIVTLGGFTSIVGEKIGHQIADEVDVAVTTGNTFTAAMAIDGVIKAARALEVDLSKSKLAIIGGTGDIGSGCARVFVDKVKELVITGRTKSNLKALHAELSKKRKAKVLVTTDNKLAVKNADIIITAASATTPIILPEWFKPKAIICDVGYPKNVSYAPVTRDDILIFSGGLAKSPSKIHFPIDTGLPAHDTLYGCFSEAIILALEKRFENYSFGRGNITPEKIDQIRSLGAKHGFEAADFYWGHTLVDQALIDSIKTKG